MKQQRSHRVLSASRGAQGAVRAVEQGRYLVRAANTGISGAVDPYGRVLTRSGLFEPAMLSVDVRVHAGRTIYSRIGDVVVWASLIATAWMLLLLRAPAGGRRGRSRVVNPGVQGTSLREVK